MKHTITSLSTAATLLAVSVAAFAGGGMRANGAFSQSAGIHEQASMRMQSPTMTTRSMPTTSAAAQTTVQTNGRTRLGASATEHTTGQPNASCEDNPTTPGNSASAPGSAFNPEGTAGSVYAGEQPQNSRNPVSVSQYDVACIHQP